jgi:hypothetical protein
MADNPSKLKPAVKFFMGSEKYRNEKGILARLRRE